VAITPGTRLGAYDITAQIGEGGMGQVYRATDRKLKRQVAFKILPPSVAADAERLARFQREAEVLASLNHPNIAGIYGLEESGGVTALVMELVEGDDLSRHIARGAIPIDNALPIAKQIADALEAAHEKGIVHRDLKPANIKVRPDGTVKVLDFGLAKAMDPVGASSANAMNSPTISMHATEAGIILGTAAYMSPEQARGTPVDRRTDVWAFGCVVFEMLSGKRPFDTGRSVSDAIAAILKTEPDWTQLPLDTPVGIRVLLARCLRKDATRRLHDIADARIELEEVSSQPLALPTPSARSRSERLAWMIAIGALTTLVAVSATAYRRRPITEMPETRLQIVGPFSEPRPPVIAPDGRTLVFAAQAGGKTQLWLRSLGSLQAQPLAGTDNAELPFWSPDSRFIGFFANGKLKRVSASGGAVEIVANAATARGGTWNRDNVILFASGFSGGLFRVAASGGEVVPVTKPGPQESSHRLPQFLPDGQHFLFFVQGSAPGVYVGALDGTTRRLLNADSQASFEPPGSLLFVRENRLFVQPFDAARFTLTGEPSAVADQISLSSEVANLAAFSVSENHTLVFRAGDTGETRQLMWFDRAGKPLQTFNREPAAMVNPSLSPEGTRIAFNRLNGTFDVWLMDAVRGNVTRVTSNPAIDIQPVWTPDGRSLVFSSNQRGNYCLFKQAVDSPGSNELLLNNTEGDFLSPRDVSADGQFLLYLASSPNTGWDIWAIALSGEERKPFPVVATSFEERDPVFSPDGRWIAYQSDETGRFEIYAQSFPGRSGKVSISNTGGTQPRWSRNGKEIFYIRPDSTLMAAPISSEPDTLRVGVPVALFQTRIAGGALVPAPNKQQYDVSRDGGRFIVNMSIEEASTTPITVILNWKPPGS